MKRRRETNPNRTFQWHTGIRYVHDWQWMLGCALLLLASAMSSLWIRSLWRKDGFEIIPGQCTDLIISSNDGYFDCHIRRFGQRDMFAGYNVTGWYSVERQPGNNEGLFPRIEKRSSNHVAIVDGSWTIFPSKSYSLIVPYPATTVFVTVLSAALLLHNHTKKKSRQLVKAHD